MMRAFWKYDLFPFMLSGTVSNFLPNGSVETVEFGRGYRFKPVVVLPDEIGNKLAQELDHLKVAHAEAERELKREFASRLDKITSKFIAEELKNG